MCDSQGTVQLSEAVSCNFLPMTVIFHDFPQFFQEKIRDTLGNAASYLTLPNSPSTGVLTVQSKLRPADFSESRLTKK
jgi:hypothetical protein